VRQDFFIYFSNKTAIKRCDTSSFVVVPYYILIYTINYSTIYP
jgi:hypothetical protein